MHAHCSLQRGWRELCDCKCAKDILWFVLIKVCDIRSNLVWIVHEKSMWILVVFDVERQSFLERVFKAYMDNLKEIRL